MHRPPFPARKSLGFFPTPLHPLRRLTQDLPVSELWIKRDDQTGLALGGNKTRKLEFLIGEALSQNCDSVITAGAAQSNHCRQTAAAAAAVGLKCHLILGGAPDSLPNGNLLLDHLFGASIHWSGSDRKGETIPLLVEKLRADGQKPFIIPYGGSNSVGALGFVEAMHELAEQEIEFGIHFDAIVFASSSGATQAGCLVGRELTKLSTQIIGIRIDKEEAHGVTLDAHIVKLANETAKRLGCSRRFIEEDLTLCGDYTGKGYGCVGTLENESIRRLAGTEGILVDPVYTGRAFGGLIDLIQKGRFRGQRILFWHTGGSPAIFSHADELVDENDTKTFH